MLRCLMDQGCHLIDYERVVDDSGKRLIFLWLVTPALPVWLSLWSHWDAAWRSTVSTARSRGSNSPIATTRIDDMKAAVRAAGDRIREDGLPAALRPLVIGITGYGNVSLGAQSILDLLPTTEISPRGVGEVTGETPGAGHTVFKAIYKESDLVRPKDAAKPFEAPGLLRPSGSLRQRVRRLPAAPDTARQLYVLGCALSTSRYESVSTRSLAGFAAYRYRRYRLRHRRRRGGDAQSDGAGRSELCVQPGHRERLRMASLATGLW